MNVFRAVIDCGGVNAAADHLDIAQPSVTAHLRALERELGSTLFMRSRGRRNVITPTGEMLYKYACEALSKSEEFQAAMKRFNPSAAQTVSIAVHQPLANYMTPRTLAAFLRDRPDARISVYTEPLGQTMKLLRDGSVDAAIAFATAESEKYEGALIGTERLCIIAAPTHPLARQKRVTLADLEHFEFVGGLQESAGWGMVDSMLRDAGLPNRRIVLRMQGTISVINAVIHGIGLACTIACAARQEIANGRLVALDIDPPLPAITVKLMTRENTMCRELLGAVIPALIAAQQS